MNEKNYTFIRIDKKGHWRGTEHRSSLLGMGDEDDSLFEDGVSCYLLKGGEDIERLRDYWDRIASCRKPEDFTGMQITIFRGILLEKCGSDWEELAICEETIAVLDAVEIMSQVINLHDLYLDEEINEEEYYDKLFDLVSVYVK